MAIVLIFARIMADFHNETIYTAVGGAITTLVGWIIGRRKSNAEASKSEAEATRSQLENVEKAIEIWKRTAEESQKHLQHEINNLRTQINGLYAKIRDQDRIISCYATELIRLGANPEKLLTADEEDQLNPSNDERTTDRT